RDRKVRRLVDGRIAGKFHRSAGAGTVDAGLQGGVAWRGAWPEQGLSQRRKHEQGTCQDQPMECHDCAPESAEVRMLDRSGDHMVNSIAAAMTTPSHCRSASLAAAANLASRHDHSLDSRYSAASFRRGESA